MKLTEMKTQPPTPSLGKRRGVKNLKISLFARERSRESWFYS
jgi:hypothetical protein